MGWCGWESWPKRGPFWTAWSSDSRVAADRRHRVAAIGYRSLQEWDLALQQFELTLREYAAPLPQYDGSPQRQLTDEINIRLDYARLLKQRDPQAAMAQFESILQRRSDSRAASPGLDPLYETAALELGMMLAETREEADWNRFEMILSDLSQRDPEGAGAAVRDRLRAMLLSRKGRNRGERRTELRERPRAPAGTVALRQPAAKTSTGCCWPRYLSRRPAWRTTLPPAARNSWRPTINGKRPSISVPRGTDRAAVAVR